MPRVSAEVSYFRRWYGNFIVIDNTATSLSDYSPFSVTAPANALLPGGGNYSHHLIQRKGFGEDAQTDVVGNAAASR